MASKKQTEPTPAPAAAATFPRLSIIERRIASGARNVSRPRQVGLINQPEPMTTRMINTVIDSRYHQVTDQLGWEPVKPEEVAGGLPQGDLRAVDGRVVAGEQGRELLVKMPTAAYREIMRARAQRDHRDMIDRTKLKQRTQQALERDAKDLDKSGAEGLERASELFDGRSRIASVEVERFDVSKEMVPIEPPSR